ncbi:hypothetical protein RC1_1089 [Rhodospirillum centenum SW]|uniref:Uncharacterized protein n=1 Tax=Rhodospirillum centenum (strain ATCC 51521 / SW) TaxID=414684 RepID=B6ISR9_RHOCS|nr:hypothetical protein RC1_1089 [Rhodospirillum centenum SW]
MNICPVLVERRLLDLVADNERKARERITALPPFTVEQMRLVLRSAADAERVAED